MLLVLLLNLLSWCTISPAFGETLSDIQQVKELSQKLQTILSDPKRESQFSKERLAEMAIIQSKLLNFQRVHSVLNSSNCNNDPTTKNHLSSTILGAAESSRSCGATYGMETLSEHRKIESLLEEVQMIEDHHYSGMYTLDKQGKISYPWEWQGKVPTTKLKMSLGSPVSEGEEVSALRTALYKQALRDTFETFLFLSLKAPRKIEVEKIVEEFCASCPLGLKTALNERAKEVIRLSAPTKSAQDVALINKKITELNFLVQRLETNARKGFTLASDKFGEYQKSSPALAMKTGPKFNDRDQFFDSEVAKKDYAAYRAIHSDLVSKDPGTLILTDTLRKTYGLKEFSPFAFLGTLPTLKASSYEKALAEARGHAADHGQSLVRNFHSKKPYDEQIEEMIRLNPSAVASVLMQDPSLSFKVCGLLKNISIAEMNSKQVEDVVMWGGVVVGGVLTASGVGLIPMSIVGAITTAPDVGYSWAKYQDSKVEVNAAFAEGKGARLARAVEKNEAAKSNLGLSLGLSIAGVLADAHFILMEAKPLKAALVNPKLNYFLEHQEETASIVKKLLKPFETDAAMSEAIIDQLYSIHVTGGEIRGKISLPQLREKAREIQKLEKMLGLKSPEQIKDLRSDIKKMMDSGALGLTADVMEEMRGLYPELMPLLTKELGEEELMGFLKKADRVKFKERADALLNKCGLK